MTEEQTQRQRFGELYAPVLEEMKSHSSVAETFIDTERYRIYLTTLWANAVARPGAFGLAEEELEAFYGYLNEQAQAYVTDPDPILDSFRFLRTESGERALARGRVPKHVRDFLAHLGTLMLDPDGLRAQLSVLRPDL